MGGVGLVLAMASLGLPGLANFVGEFLILAGVFQVSPGLAAIAAVGLVVSVVYSLRIVQRVFHGPGPENGSAVADLTSREALVFGAGIALLVWIGLNPQPVLDLVQPVFQAAGVLP